MTERKREAEPAEVAAMLVVGAPMAVGLMLLRPYAMLLVASWYGLGPGPSWATVLVLWAVLALRGGTYQPRQASPTVYEIVAWTVVQYAWVGLLVGTAWALR